jgi:hypothetical protein
LKLAWATQKNLVSKERGEVRGREERKSSGRLKANRREIIKQIPFSLIVSIKLTNQLYTSLPKN